MLADVADVTVRAVLPTPQGCGLFLFAERKTFVIYVDPSIGQSIALALSTVKKERPLTHDLVGNIFAGFGIMLERVVINDAISGTFYARIILKMENELGVKLVEVDARPSDAIVLALNAKKPIVVSRAVLDKSEDVSALLGKLLKEKN